MANANTPFGARVIKKLDGSPWTGALTRYYVPSTDATAIFIGDAVEVTGAAHSDYTPIVARLTHAGDSARGIMVAIDTYPEDLNLNYRKASTGMHVLVCDDPNIIFEMQEDAAATLVAADAGGNVDITVTAGSTASGRSAMVLASASINTTASQVRLLRLSNKPGNVVGQYAVWECMWNEHDFKTTTGA